MAIQMRRGLWANLDTSKLVAGEIVCGTDAGTDHVGIAKAPSQLIELATKEDIDGKQDTLSIDNDGYINL